MLGMGQSEKLPDSGPGRYTNAEHREYMFGLWEQLELGDEIVFVVHDWGSLLAFDWANRNPSRVQGVAYMEAILRENMWADFPEAPREAIRTLRSPPGDDMVLQDYCRRRVDALLQAAGNGLCSDVGTAAPSHAARPAAIALYRSLRLVPD
jgi:pimeloyl-ACP methyl ester carboxylesterase